MVSRYGTLGVPKSTLAWYLRRIRLIITLICSSPIPKIINSLVWLSREVLQVRSSLVKRESTEEIFSSSWRVLGLTDAEYAGAGNSARLKLTGRELAQMLSWLKVIFNLATAAISPAETLSTAIC